MMQSQNYRGVIADKPEGHYPSGGLLTQQLELMQEISERGFEMESRRPRFTTIDDMIDLARKLVDGLNKLGAVKHPLGIRRGVRNMVERKTQSEMLKTRAKTYFFDIRETKDGKPFLVITESRLKGKGEKPERSSIIVFQDSLKEFAKNVSRMADKITEGN